MIFIFFHFTSHFIKPPKKLIISSSRYLPFQIQHSVCIDKYSILSRISFDIMPLEITMLQNKEE